MHIYYECGICGYYHPWNWNGDCRDDTNRFTSECLDRRHSPFGYGVRSMDDRVKSDIDLSGIDGDY